MYLIPRFTMGGAERLVLQYAKFAKEQGLDVLVASVVGGGELAKDFTALGVKILVNEDKFWWSNYQRLKAWLKETKSEIIHSHVFSADVMGYLLRKKVIWISTQHNVGQEHSWLRRLVLKYILKQADKVIAVGERVKDFCLRDLGLDSNKVILIRNGIEITKWQKVSSEDLLTQASLRLAIIGRVEKQKGHAVLFKALAQLKKIDWHLNIYGVGSLESDLKKLAQQLKITKQITWHGVKADMSVELESIDIVVQPSLWEGLSLVVMEAMSAGRLVITTPPGGEELLDKQTGLIVPVEDEKALAQAIIWVNEHREEAKIMAQTAQTKIQKFSLNTHWQELNNLYHEKD